MSCDNKLLNIDGIEVPHPDCLLGGWVDNVTKWPSTQSSDVIYYLLETPSDFDGKALKAYKSTKAFSYYKDGWVKTCLYHDISERSKFCYIRANVLPSFKLNEKHHKTWVLLEKEIGSICSAGCTCMAGLGQCCNHVAALLFKIEDAIKLGYNSLTCTSMPCTWNKGCSKPVENAPLCDIKNLFKKDVRGRDKKRFLGKIDFEPLNSKRKREEPKDVISSVMKDICQVNQNAPIITSFSKASLMDFGFEVPTETNTPPTLLDMAKQFISCNSEELAIENILPEFMESLKYTKYQIGVIEKITRDQAHSSYWKDYRCGMLTASKCKLYSDKIEAIKVKKNKTDCSYLIKQCMSVTDNLEYIPAVKWGIDHEDQAIKQYIQSEQAKHKNITVTKSGLHISQEHAFLGASPDGIVQCDCCPFRVLECKCPYSIRDRDPHESLNARDIKFLELKDGIPCLNRKHLYYAQVQMQMAITKSKDCDFVVWTSKNILILKVAFDQSFWEKLLFNLITFFSEHVSGSLLKTL